MVGNEQIISIDYILLVHTGYNLQYVYIHLFWWQECPRPSYRTNANTIILNISIIISLLHQSQEFEDI